MVSSDVVSIVASWSDSVELLHETKTRSDIAKTELNLNMVLIFNLEFEDFPANENYIKFIGCLKVSFRTQLKPNNLVHFLTRKSLYGKVLES